MKDSVKYEDLVVTGAWKDMNGIIKKERSDQIPLMETNTKSFRERYKKDPLDIGRLITLKKQYKKEMTSLYPGWTWKSSMSRKYVTFHTKS